MAFQIEALDTAELSKELEIEELARLLEARGVEVFQVDGRTLIAVATWERVRREAVQAWLRAPDHEAGSAGEVRAERDWIDVPEQARFESQWNERRTRLLDRHPWLRELVDSFVNYVTDRDPNARVQQHGQTVTFVMPRGRRAGLRLRTKGIWLAARRQGEEISEWVRSHEDFERGLRWLQALPDY